MQILPAMLAVIIAVAIGIGVALPAVAQIGTATFRVNAYTRGVQSEPSIGMADDGRFVVAWRSGDPDTDEWSIVARRHAADGTPQGDEFSVNTYTQGSGSQTAAVGAAADGRFVIAWISEHPNGAGWGAYARRYAADGTPQGVEFRVSTNTSSSPYILAAVGMGPDGRFVVVWSGVDQGTLWDGYARLYGADGVPQGDEFRVNTYTPNVQANYAAAMAADGRFLIVWESVNQDGSEGGIYAQRYRADGTPQGAEFRVNTFTRGYQDYPSVGMAPDGRFVVVWASQNQDGSSWGVYAQRFAADGSPQGPEFRVNTTTHAHQNQPAVGVRPDGEFVVVWSNQGFNANDALGVYAQRFSAAGAPQGSEFRMSGPTSGFQGWPAVAMARDGRFVVAWAGVDPADSTSDVYAQRFTGAISTCLPRPRVLVQTSAGVGLLNVSISAKPLNDFQPNLVRELRFGVLRNAKVTLGGQQVTSGQIAAVVPQSTTVNFVVERESTILPLQSTIVPFTVVDACGEWRSFVGGGLSAF